MKCKKCNVNFDDAPMNGARSWYPHVGWVCIECRPITSCSCEDCRAGFGPGDFRKESEWSYWDDYAARAFGLNK